MKLRREGLEKKNQNAAIVNVMGKEHKKSKYVHMSCWHAFVYVTLQTGAIVTSSAVFRKSFRWALGGGEGLRFGEIRGSLA